MPSIGFGVVECHFFRIEWTQKGSVLFGRDKAVFRIEEIFVGLCTLNKFTVDFFVSRFFCNLRYTPVVVGQFECFGNTFGFLVRRNITELPVWTCSASGRIGCFNHGIQQQLLSIRVYNNVIHDCIGDNRNAMVTDHTESLIGSEFPDGQQSGLLKLFEKSEHIIAGTFSVNNAHQGMISSVGVPKRKNRVVIKSFRFMYFEIAPQI
ncbi:hypothetical protein SDC9_77997 [bioreactor metagenome]|uniref:Uncharacterized protein n=1 Tax=bioreactor metagenome TaxID=1076179 RepID=A0A644YS76_9ZZZZ